MRDLGLVSLILLWLFTLMGAAATVVERVVF